jgi:hypothetical protein
MFETLFCYPRVLARHRAGPAAEERDRFLAHQAQVGAAPKSLLRLASELLLVARRIDVSGPTVITPREIEAAADGCRPWQRSASARTACAIRPQLTCCARALRSTPCAHGLGTLASTRPTSTPRSISKGRHSRSRSAT